MTETATQTAPVPGWYQDPQGQGLRWWDGSGWTTHTQQSAPPAPEPAPATAPQAQPVAAAPAVAQPAASVPAATPTPSPGVKVTGAEKKKGGSLSEKLNDNPLPVLLVLAAILVVVVVLFVL